MIKAAKGGAVSPLNGCDYKGGQFMPETGEYCGLGKNRVARKQVDAINAKLTNAEIVWNESASVFQLVRIVTLANGAKAKQVFFSSANVKTLEKCIN
jgi:hypothetical protein